MRDIQILYKPRIIKNIIFQIFSPSFGIETYGVDVYKQFFPEGSFLYFPENIAPQNSIKTRSTVCGGLHNMQSVDHSAKHSSSFQPRFYEENGHMKL